MQNASFTVCVAITGASGTLYAEHLVANLRQHADQVFLVASRAGKIVAKYELAAEETGDFSLLRALQGKEDGVTTFRNDDFFAPIACGNSVPAAMIVTPCSMGTLGRIATGTGQNLLERAADVVLKQKKHLIICPREAPLNTIHLRNMLTLAEMGATILPLMPGFYNHPKTIDDIVGFMTGRVLELLDIPAVRHQLYRPWTGFSAAPSH